MIGAAKRYRELLVDLGLRRLASGGALAPDVESPLVGALDRCWRQMTDAEQDEADRLYALGRHVSASAELQLEDREVPIGGSVAPRLAAA